MISHDRTADQSHEYLSCNDFFGQGSNEHTPLIRHGTPYWLILPIVHMDLVTFHSRPLSKDACQKLWEAYPQML